MFNYGSGWRASSGAIRENPTNEVSRALGIERHQLRRALHRIKRAQGLGGADSVTIWDDGAVRDHQGNVLGNVYDEI